mgnify:CR=1 FL=1
MEIFYDDNKGKQMSLAKLVGERIAYARQINDMSATELSKQLTIAPQTICNWEKGRKSPSIDTVIKISYIFNISIEYFLGVSDSPTGIDARCLHVTNTHNFQATDSTDEISVPSIFLDNDDKRIIIQITDDSMTNLFRKNDYVVINKDIGLVDGCFGLFEIIYSNQVLFRQYVIDNSSPLNPLKKLAALNDRYPDIPYDACAIKVHGVCRDNIRLIG